MIKHVKIYADCGGLGSNRTKIEVDGRDITQHVAYYVIRHAAFGMPMLCLEMPCEIVEFEGAVLVETSEEATED